MGINCLRLGLALLIGVCGCVLQLNAAADGGGAGNYFRLGVGSRAQAMGGAFSAVADDPQAARQAYIDEYTERFDNPLTALELGYIDDVINPEETRRRLTLAFDLLKNKVDTNPKKKHGNIPL